MKMAGDGENPIPAAWSFRFARLVMVGLVVAIAGLALGTWSRAQPQGAPALAPFEGKFLLVYKRSDPTFSISLEKARLESLGATSFLVGTGADDEVPENWQTGQTIWIALDDISEITLFDTIDELRDVLSELDPRVAARHGSRDQGAPIPVSLRPLR